MSAEMLYSGGLLLALPLAVGALAVAVAERLAGWRRSAGWARRLAVGALLPLTVSLLVHLFRGHGHATSEPMGLGRFLAVHPVYPTLAAASLLAWVLAGATDGGA